MRNFFKSLKYDSNYFFGFNREKFLDKAAESLKLNGEELKIQINNSVFSSYTLKDNFKINTNVLNFVSSLPLRHKELFEISLFDYKYKKHNRLGWFINSRFGSFKKQPYAVPSLTESFGNDILIKDLLKLSTVHVTKKYVDNGKFRHGQKLLIYTNNKLVNNKESILCEINVIDDYNNIDLKNHKYLGIVNDPSATGKFKLYCGKNDKIYNHLSDEIDWFVVTLVAKKRKDTTLIDWLYIIEESLPRFNIHIDMENSYVKDLSLFTEVYTVIGLFRIQFFKVFLKIKNHDRNGDD